MEDNEFENEPVNDPQEPVGNEDVEDNSEFTMDDFINSIDNNTLSDAEEMFNSIMDDKVAQRLDAMRQQYAASIFDDSPATVEDDIADEAQENRDDNV